MGMGFDELCAVKSGDELYESCAYGTYKFKVISTSVSKDTVEFTGEIIEGCEPTGKTVDFLITKGLEHYGPSIYKYPAYGNIIGAK